MNPVFKRKYFIAVIKFISLVPILVAAIFLLIKGNFLSRSAILFLAASTFVYKLWRRKHHGGAKYDDVGYWSGLDDFELGIDSHIFDDLKILDDDLELFSDDYYDRRPV